MKTNFDDRNAKLEKIYFLRDSITIQSFYISLFTYNLPSFIKLAKIYWLILFILRRLTNKFILINISNLSQIICVISSSLLVVLYGLIFIGIH